METRPVRCRPTQWVAAGRERVREPHTWGRSWDEPSERHLRGNPRGKSENGARAAHAVDEQMVEGRCSFARNPALDLLCSRESGGHPWRREEPAPTVDGSLQAGALYLLATAVSTTFWCTALLRCCGGLTPPVGLGGRATFASLGVADQPRHPPAPLRGGTARPWVALPGRDDRVTERAGARRRGPSGHRGR